MTSPDFMYPQPTDDELAAQQPIGLPVGSRVHGTYSADQAHPARRDPSAHHDPTSGPIDPTPGPAGPTSGSADPHVSPARVGRIALTLAIIAGGVSFISSVILGVTVGPIEAADGHYFSDTPAWYRGLAIGLFGLQALCTALGITGLIMGIVAAVTGRGRTQGIIATAIALVAPLISFALFLVLSFAFA